MEYDSDSTRLLYHGWEIRSHLTHCSLNGTVAAGAMLFLGEACKCHIVSSKQFADSANAISAIETKAVLWIDVFEISPRMNQRLLCDPDRMGARISQPELY